MTDEWQPELRHHQQHQLDGITRQCAQEEQKKEFELERREAQYYQRTLERERQNSMSASVEEPVAHRSGSTTTGPVGDRSSVTFTLNSFAGSTWSRSDST
jgi:hypothetical protein